MTGDRTLLDELDRLSGRSEPHMYLPKAVRESRTQQPTRSDPTTPRDEGAAAAELSLHTGWRLWAEAELDRLIVSGREFTADDLRAVVGDPPDGKHTSGIGGMFLRAAKAGRITMAGYRPSTRPEARSRVLRVWRGAS